MRRVMFGVLLIGVAASARAQEPLPATDVTAAQMAAFLKALPRNEINDLPVRVVDVGGSRVGVYGVFRPKDQPGDAIAHETRTSEVYYILEGGGTLVTGGTMSIQDRSPRTAAPAREARRSRAVSRAT